MKEKKERKEDGETMKKQTTKPGIENPLQNFDKLIKESKSPNNFGKTEYQRKDRCKPKSSRKLYVLGIK